jgi:hypothetical protein
LLGASLSALALFQNIVVYRAKVIPQVRSFTAGLDQSLIPWGKWFATHTAPGVTIAAPDIGALGFYSQRKVLDLAGLVTPEMVPLLQKEQPEDIAANFSFVAVGRPDFLVDRALRPYELSERSRYGPALIPLGHASVPNLGIARPGAVVYSFYRVDWAAYDSLRAEH